MISLLIVVLIWVLLILLVCKRIVVWLGLYHWLNCLTSILAFLGLQLLLHHILLPLVRQLLINAQNHLVLELHLAQNTIVKVALDRGQLGRAHVGRLKIWDFKWFRRAIVNSAQKINLLMLLLFSVDLSLLLTRLLRGRHLRDLLLLTLKDHFMHLLRLRIHQIRSWKSLIQLYLLVLKLCQLKLLLL